MRTVRLFPLLSLLFLWSGRLCLPVQAQAGAPWIIYSPLPDTLVADGELLVAVTVEPGIRLDTTSIQLLLDGQDVTFQTKRSETSVRMLYTRLLGGGRHALTLTARTTDGTALSPLEWTFLVEGTARADGRPPRVFTFSGISALDTRNADISGRRDLRQEPLRTYAFNLDADGVYGGWTFPVKIYATTDDNSTAQPRNRFLIGARSDRFSLLVGDNTPLFNPILLNGTRTRGFMGSADLGAFHLTLLRGQTRRSIAPEVFRTGVFERTLSAARLSIGHPRTVLFSLNALKARDDASSIPPAEATAVTPMENLVAGTDLLLRFRDGKYQVEGGAALSLTTSDLSRGPATKAEIDSLFDIDLPIDPASLEWLITLNASTVPLRLDQLSSLAWYAKARARIRTHLLSADVEQVGSAFTSFGNPFLQSDRRSVTFSDQFRVLQGKLSGNLRLRKYGTPPHDDPRLSTLDALLFSSQLVAMPFGNQTWMYVGLNLHDRMTTTEGSGAPLSDTQVITYSAGGYHLLRTGAFQHGLNLNASYAVREDVLRPSLDNVTRTVSLSLNEQLPIPLYFNASLNLLRVSSDALGTWQKLNTTGLRLGYRLSRQHLNLSTGAQHTAIARTQLLSPSNRFLFNLNGQWQVRTDMALELQLGISTYREPANAANRYTERYVLLRHRYTF